MNFFFYGSLMSAAVFEQVTGTSLSRLPIPPVTGKLFGYRRFKVRGQLYPGIEQTQNMSVFVPGLIVVCPEALEAQWTERLDEFEGVDQVIITAHYLSQ